MMYICNLSTECPRAEKFNCKHQFSLLHCNTTYYQNCVGNDAEKICICVPVFELDLTIPENQFKIE